MYRLFYEKNPSRTLILAGALEGSRMPLSAKTTCRSLVLIAALAALTAAAPRTRPESSSEVTTVKVTDRVIAFVGRDPTRDVVVGNVVAVIGDESVLLVDSTNAPSNARFVLAELRKITDKPVRYIVHTHWHYDHIMGDTVFAKAFSPLDVVVQMNTLPLLEAKIPSWPERGATVYAKIRDQFRGELASGKDEHGAELNAVDRARHQQTIDDVERYLPEFPDMGYVRPTVTFSDRMTLYLGSLEVRIIYVGAGNTDGDAVVYVPQEGVLATGDLLVYPIPYAFGAHPESWARGLAQLVEIPATAIVPGHGPVFHDKAYLTEVQRLLQATAAGAKEAKARGVSVEIAQKTIDLEAFRRDFAGDDPALDEVWRDYYRDPAIASAYADLAGSK